MVIASMWTSMAAWFTPTVLFCVLNLVIATIFLASNFRSPNDHHDNTQAPSLLERVKSVDLSSSYTTPDTEPTGYNSMRQLSRSPSLMERVKSIDFSFSSFYATPQDQSRPESERTHPVDSPSRLARAPSLLERVKSINLPSFYAQNKNPFPSESEQLINSPGPSNGVNSDHDSGDTFSSHQHAVPDPDHDPILDHLVTSSMSKKSGVTPAKKSSGKMEKSLSERRVPASDESEEDVDRRRPATMKASARASDESVDAKADDFINRFKQQLKLQRLDSLERLKEMLNRGTSSH